MRLLLLSLFLFALAACAEDTVETPPAEEVSTASEEETSDLPTCYPDSIGELIGQPVAALEAHPDRPSDVRLIGPDTLVTQEYLPNRLNVHLDKDGRINRLDCG